MHSCLFSFVDLNSVYVVFVLALISQAPHRSDVSVLRASEVRKLKDYALRCDLCHFDTWPCSSSKSNEIGESFDRSNLIFIAPFIRVCVLHMVIKQQHQCTPEIKWTYKKR